MRGRTGATMMPTGSDERTEAKGRRLRPCGTTRSTAGRLELSARSDGTRREAVRLAIDQESSRPGREVRLKNRRNPVLAGRGRHEKRSLPFRMVWDLLLSNAVSAPSRGRTCNLRIRSPMGEAGSRCCNWANSDSQTWDSARESLDQLDHRRNQLTWQTTMRHPCPHRGSAM